MMAMPDSGPGSHREYARWRSRQIAYGRWEPCVDAAPVREHVRALRQAGASYEAIARAAGVAAMTVHRLLHGEPAKGRGIPGRIRAAPADRLLAVTAAGLRDAAARRDATGTRRRLRALIAMGHPAVSLARAAGISPRVVWGIARGTTATVSRGVHDEISVLYERHGTCGRQSAARPSGGRLVRHAAGLPRTGGQRRWAWTTSGSMILLTGRVRTGARPVASGRLIRPAARRARRTRLPAETIAATGAGGWTWRPCQ